MYAQRNNYFLIISETVRFTKECVERVPCLLNFLSQNTICHVMTETRRILIKPTNVKFIPTSSLRIITRGETDEQVCRHGNANRSVFDIICCERAKIHVENPNMATGV
jgi:hypothetical protein